MLQYFSSRRDLQDGLFENERKMILPGLMFKIVLHSFSTTARSQLRHPAEKNSLRIKSWLKKHII